jgi:uncharacterized protein YndB with AHSA1/START domain
MSEHTIPAVPEVTDADVLISRSFDAPRDVVWRFFTEPELLALWFGPTSVHVDPSTVRVQLHPGGSWDLDMVDNETGEHYPFRSRLTVVIPPEYLEGSEIAGADLSAADGITLRIWLHDHAPTTRLTLHQGPFTSAFRDETRAGWLLSFDKIDAILKEQNR